MQCAVFPAIIYLTECFRRGRIERRTGRHYGTHKTEHGTSLEPDITVREVYEEVDSVNQKLDRVLNELGEIKQTLTKLASSMADVQSKLDEME